jgi:hypothetical protein
MAGIPLNTFRTSVKIVQPENAAGSQPWVAGHPAAGDNYYLAYTAPPGTSGVILYAQVANIGTVTYQVSMWHYRANQFPTSFTELLVGAYAPTNDALVLLGGKLVLETGDSVYIAGTAPIVSGSSDLKLTMSILESANQ